jgi:predicted NACHT family NTPase
LIKQLSQIAAITFEQEEFYFKLDTIQKKFEESDLVSEDWLKCIEARHGLLVKRGRRTYSFSHQTFQEYLTAEAFVSSDEPKALKKLVNNITDLRWHEVFLLTTEMLPNPNELLEQMKQQVDKMLISEGNESLQQFLKWLYQKPIPCNPRYFQPKPAAVRAFYLARVLNFDIDFHPNDAFLLARSLSKSRYVYEALSEDYYGIFTQMYQLTLERNLADTLKLLRFSVRDLKSEGKLARMLASDMYWKLLDLLEPLKEQLASDEEDLVEWWRYHGQVWMNKLKLMIIEYHNIDHNLQFTDEQKELLKQYYDANQLLMDCLNSDCKVSDEVRSHIEDTLLLQQFSYW